MAHSTISFKHPTFGTVKSAPVGFSWTTALFGFWPALFRSDFKWAAIQFGITVGVSLVTMGIGAIVVWLAFGFIYNKIYIKGLVEQGFQVSNFQSEYTLEQLQAQVETVLVRLDSTP